MPPRRRKTASAPKVQPPAPPPLVLTVSSDPTTLSAMENLAPELLNNIIEMASEGQTGDENRKMYHDLCLVSKTLNATATAYLYRSFSNTGEKKPFAQFLGMVAKNPELAKYVQSLRLQGWQTFVVGPSQDRMRTTITDPAEISAGKNFRCSSFRFKVAQLCNAVTEVQSVTFSFLLSNISNIYHLDNCWQDALLISRAIQEAKRARPTVLRKLRAFEIEFGIKHFPTHLSLWDMFREALEIPGLEDLTFTCWDHLRAVPNVEPAQIAGIKRLIVKGSGLGISPTSYLIKHCRALEHFVIQWKVERATVVENALFYSRIYSPGWPEQSSDISALVRALLPHKNSLKSLSINTRHLPLQAYGRHKTFESLEAFERLEHLTLDHELNSWVFVNGVRVTQNKFLLGIGGLLPPNLKSLTICTTSENLILFELLSQLAFSGPASLKSIKAIFMELQEYRHNSHDYETGETPPGFTTEHTKHFVLKTSPRPHNVVIVSTNSFDEVARSINEPRATPGAHRYLPALDGFFPVCMETFSLIFDASIGPDFKLLLDKYPAETRRPVQHSRLGAAGQSLRED